MAHKEIKEPQFKAKDNNGDPGTPHASFYDLFIVSLTIFSLMVVVVLAIFPVSEAVANTLTAIDWLICIIFLIDFFWNMRAAPNKRVYFFKGGGWLDLLGSIPPFPTLRWTSVFRLFRIFRLTRIVPVIRARGLKAVWEDFMDNRAQNTLLITVFITIVVITIAAVVVLQVETRSAEANITTGGDAFWWAFVTVTTVGYGDRFPTTGLGRIMAMILMTLGVGIFGVLASYMASVFLAPEGEEVDEQPEAVVPETPSLATSGTLHNELLAMRAQMTVMHEAMGRLEAQLQEMSDNN